MSLSRAATRLLVCAALSQAAHIIKDNDEAHHVTQRILQRQKGSVHLSKYRYLGNSFVRSFISFIIRSFIHSFILHAFNASIPTRKKHSHEDVQALRDEFRELQEKHFPDHDPKKRKSSISLMTEHRKNERERALREEARKVKEKSE